MTSSKLECDPKNLTGSLITVEISLVEKWTTGASATYNLDSKIDMNVILIYIVIFPWLVGCFLTNIVLTIIKSMHADIW